MGLARRIEKELTMEDFWRVVEVIDKAITLILVALTILGLALRTWIVE
jgi:hypothetical protein